MVGHGLAPGEHRGQYLVIDFHQAQRLFGHVLAHGTHGGDGVADVKGLVLGQHVFRDHAGVALHLGKVQHAVLHDGEIRRRSHRHDAGHGLALLVSMLRMRAWE